MENINYLITGGSGFLGAIISNELGKTSTVHHLGRGSENTIVNDLSRQVPLLSHYYDTIIHCAGKAHSVPRSTEEAESFFKVNVEGTKNLLASLTNLSIKPHAFVFISSVAVYGLDSGIGIKETHALAATDPYGKSKIETEDLVQGWCKNNNVICMILRLPLLAGPNPPGNLGAMIRGIKKGYYFNIAGGNSKKSMVMAEDIATIIPKGAIFGGIYNLTDGEHPTFAQLSEVISKQLRKKSPPNIPVIIAKSLGIIGDIIGNVSPINSKKLKKMEADLTFDDTKARKVLGWKPKRILASFKVK